MGDNNEQPDIEALFKQLTSNISVEDKSRKINFLVNVNFLIPEKFSDISSLIHVFNGNVKTDKQEMCLNSVFDNKVFFKICLL